MGSLTKALIGKEDLSIASDSLTPSTYARTSSTGGTVTMTSFPDLWRTHMGGIISAKSYSPGTLTAATINAAINAISSDSRTLYIEPGAWVMEDNITVPSNITLFMARGAIITPDGNTLTINGELSAGRYQIFDAATAEVVLNSASVERIMPEWWGTVGDASTDDSTAFQVAVDCYKAVVAAGLTASYYYDGWRGPVFSTRPGAIYKLNTALYTGGSLTSCVKIWEGNGATILGADAGEPVIDNTGGHSWHWSDLVIEGDSSSVPSCGLFLSRPSDGSSAGKGYHEKLHIVGSFTYSALYNIASESNTFIQSWFLIYSGQAAVILTRGNNRSVDPTGGQAIYDYDASGAISATTQSFYHCTFFNNDRTTGVTTNHSVFEIDSWTRVSIRDSLMHDDYGKHASSIDFVDGDVNTTTDVITEAAHGYSDGDAGRLTTTGVLPTGLAAATDYFIIDDGTNTFQLASSYANAIAGTAVDITNAAGGGTHTFTRNSPNRPFVKLRNTRSVVKSVLLDGVLFHEEYMHAIRVEQGASGSEVYVYDLNVRNCDFGNTTNNTDNSSWQLKMSNYSRLYNAHLEGVHNIDASGTECQISSGSYVSLGGRIAGCPRDSSDQRTFTLAGAFQGELHCRSTDVVTITDKLVFDGTIHYLNTGEIADSQVSNMEKETSLGSGNITLTAAALIGGYITEDPGGAADWTIDTAANIVAALVAPKVGKSFQTIVYNSGTDGANEVATIKADAAGITMHDEFDRNIASKTLTEGTNNMALLIFRVDVATSGSEAVTVFIFTNIPHHVH